MKILNKSPYANYELYQAAAEQWSERICGKATATTTTTRQWERTGVDNGTSSATYIHTWVLVCASKTRESKHNQHQKIQLTHWQVGFVLMPINIDQESEKINETLNHCTEWTDESNSPVNPTAGSWPVCVYMWGEQLFCGARWKPLHAQ